MKHPGLMLKYSTFKNLATMAATQDDLETAMEFYLEVKMIFFFFSNTKLPSRCWYFLNVFWTTTKSGTSVKPELRCVLTGDSGVVVE